MDRDVGYLSDTQEVDGLLAEQSHKLQGANARTRLRYILAMGSGWLVALALASERYMGTHRIEDHMGTPSKDVGDSVELLQEVKLQHFGLGHGEPEMWGKVKEKTIWSYWYNPKDCPSSKNCKLPPHIELCIETVKKNLGSFDHKVIHWDELPKYLNMDTELPHVSTLLKPQMQKDSLMNALLARYGGVAIDISTILFRPFDEYWNEMVNNGATFWGYMYRLNGQSWPPAMSTPVWFMMARREGVFRTIATQQALRFPHKGVSMGGMVSPQLVKFLPYSTFGDYLLTPVLHMYNYSLPLCHHDPVVEAPNLCPEYKAPNWTAGLTGPPLSNTKLILRDPRDGPIMSFIVPYAVKGGVALWNIHNTTRDTGIAPCKSNSCCSPEECWTKVFMQRFNTPTAPGRPHLINFIKMYGHGGVGLISMTRSEILKHKDSYFVNWLKLAGLDLQ